MLKDFIKRYLIPNWMLRGLRPFYHGCLAVAANFYYGRPSQKLVVAGVTGTAGKSTTIKMLSHILNAQKSGACGYITTVDFFDGKNIHINEHGLSMPSGIMIQNQLRQMVASGCKYAIVECTSEGLIQNRHLGINFKMAILTNLYGAHLEAHGGFENYKKAKSKLFKKVKTVIVNSDDPNAEDFTKFDAQKIIRCGIKNQNVAFSAKDLKVDQDSISYKLSVRQAQDWQTISYKLNLIGEFNASNALLAVASAYALGVSLSDCAKALESFKPVRGRMEEIENNLGFRVFVDYGCEPAEMTAVLESINKLPHQKIIHAFGATGGHRDVSKRFEFGKISAKYADYIIITNDDVYDSDPMEIAKNTEQGIRQEARGSSKKVDYEIVLDRREAISRALSVAQKGDVVIFTGKGSEQFLVLPGNERIKWDESKVVRELLASRY